MKKVIIGLIFSLLVFASAVEAQEKLFIMLDDITVEVPLLLDRTGDNTFDVYADFVEVARILKGELSIDEEILWLTVNTSSAAEVKSTYNKTNQKKRGFSLIDIAKHTNAVYLKTNGKLLNAIDIAQNIYYSLNFSKNVISR